MLGIESADSPQDVHAAVSALTLRFLDQYLKERREATGGGPAVTRPRADHPAPAAGRLARSITKQCFWPTVHSSSDTFA